MISVQLSGFFCSYTSDALRHRNEIGSGAARKFRNWDFRKLRKTVRKLNFLFDPLNGILLSSELTGFLKVEIFIRLARRLRNIHIFTLFLNAYLDLNWDF